MLQTNCLGIFASDVLIRSALIQGLRDLRANPLLLDYVFAWLPNDELTAQTYGLRSVEEAKKWFLNTEINVSLDVRIGEAKLPMVSITLMDSSENGETLGDIHHQVAEDGPEEGQVTNLESVLHQESYNLGLFVEGEPLFLLYLNSIIVFLLYRYKESLLEARGFQNSTIRIGRLAPREEDGRENLFTRPIVVTGTVRHYWPKLTAPKITSVEGILVTPPQTNGGPQLKPYVERSGIRIVNPANPRSAFDVSEAPWGMEDDILSGVK